MPCSRPLLGNLSNNKKKGNPPSANRFTNTSSTKWSHLVMLNSLFIENAGGNSCRKETVIETCEIYMHKPPL